MHTVRYNKTTLHERRTAWCSKEHRRSVDNAYSTLTTVVEAMARLFVKSKIAIVTGEDHNIIIVNHVTPSHGKQAREGTK